MSLEANTGKHKLPLFCKGQPLLLGSYEAFIQVYKKPIIFPQGTGDSP